MSKRRRKLKWHERCRHTRFGDRVFDGPVWRCFLPLNHSVGCLYQLCSPQQAGQIRASIACRVVARLKVTR